MPKNHVEQVVLARRLESSVTVNLLGATVTSLVMTGVERLFLSKSTILDNNTQIRSGIPFLLSLDPAHNFFRTSQWAIVEQEKYTNGDVNASFVLEDSENTRKEWDQRFKATLKIFLKKKEISFDYKIENKDSKPFVCSPMLQNHFLIDDVTNVAVLGLQDANSSDEMGFTMTTSEGGERITIDDPLNCVYTNTASEHVLKNTQDGASLFIRKRNLPDTVIWNPWDENQQGVHDITSDKYKGVICVGCGHVTHPLTLHPGAIFQAGQSFSLE